MPEETKAAANGGVAPKVYDVDAAVLEVRPFILLRGQLYRVADLTMEARFRKRREYLERYSALLEAERAHAEAKAQQAEGGAERLVEVPKMPSEEDYRAYRILGISLALEGVPDDVAGTLTEREFEAVTAAVAKVKDEDTPVLEKNGHRAPGESSPSTPFAKSSSAAAPSGATPPGLPSAPAPSSP